MKASPVGSEEPTKQLFDLICMLMAVAPELAGSENT
jgi:hypothetical protein